MSILQKRGTTLSGNCLAKPIGILNRIRIDSVRAVSTATYLLRISGRTLKGVPSMAITILISVMQANYNSLIKEEKNCVSRKEWIKCLADPEFS
jgi:hypothetical protein